MGIFFFIQIINNIMMKLLALFFLIALAFADDTKSTCVPAGTTPAACTTSSPALELSTFTYVNVTAGATVCSSVAVDSDDISDTDNVFVLATRPGEDYAGVGTSVTTTAYNTNGTATSCVKLQGTEVDDDTDYACSAISTVTATMYVASANTDAAAVYLQVYAGVTEGTTTDCTASYVSSSGSSIWLWVVIVVVCHYCCYYCR